MDKQINTSRYYSGLSGLQLPVPKYKFPVEHRDSTRLTFYSTIFNSIEINSTFYKVPRKSTPTNWNNSVGDQFRFTLKVWQQVTHQEGLAFDESDVITFLDMAAGIGPKKGCLLIQLPPSTGINSFTHLSQLLKSIRSKIQFDWDIAVEFRNTTWYCEEVYEMLDEFKSVIVTHDKARSQSPFLHSRGNVKYLRFHGPVGNYGGSYSDDFLYEYSLYIKQWIIEGKTLYVYFNNTRGDAFSNLTTLNRLVFSS